MYIWEHPDLFKKKTFEDRLWEEMDCSVTNALQTKQTGENIVHYYANSPEKGAFPYLHIVTKRSFSTSDDRILRGYPGLLLTTKRRGEEVIIYEIYGYTLFYYPTDPPDNYSSWKAMWIDDVLQIYYDPLRGVLPRYVYGKDSSISGNKNYYDQREDKSIYATTYYEKEGVITL